MKKLAVLAALTIMSLSATCFAQVGVVNINNWDVDKPITGIPAGQTAYVQLLGGASATSLAPVVSTSDMKTSVFQVDPDGHFDAGVGVVPGLTGAGPATYNLQAWVGTAGSTFANATLKGETGPFTGTANNWNNAAVPAVPAIGATLNLPATAINLSGGVPPVPEPSTIALGLIGAGALLIRRRK